MDTHASEEAIAHPDVNQFYTLIIDTPLHEKVRSEMSHTTRNLCDAKTTMTPDAFRRILAIAVLILFVAVCLGRLIAPQIALFGDLLPIISGLLGLVMRYYFTGRERA